MAIASTFNPGGSAKHSPKYSANKIQPARAEKPDIRIPQYVCCKPLSVAQVGIDMIKRQGI